MSDLILPDTLKIYEKYGDQPRMFFGEGRGLQEFIDTPYPEFLKLKDQQRAQDWAHDEFILSLDAAQLNSSNQSVQHVFTTNLQSQIFADTIQGRGPAWLIPYCSDPALEGLLLEWARMEWTHSRTYSYILTSMYSNPKIVLDMIEQKPEIHKRFTACTTAYNKFISNPNKETLVVLIAAINILEGLSFFASFACNYAFANMGLFESVGKFLSLINKDESLHVAITQNIIKNWASGKDGDEWKEVWHDNKHVVTDMFNSAIEEEHNFSKELFKYGTPSSTLNESLLNDYIAFQAARRAKNIKIKLNVGVTKNPLPWIDTKYASQRSRADAPQETKKIAYAKNPIQFASDSSYLDKYLKDASNLIF